MKAVEKPQVIIYTTLFLLIALIALILTVSGCYSERVEGNRDVISQDRSSRPFNEVVSQGSFNVVLIPAEETRIVVKAESNILPYIYTSSDGTTLTVKFSDGVNIHEHYPVEVFLYTPVLKSARLSGSGNIQFSGFNSTEMSLQISGSGNMNADFITNSLTASISGSGNMYLAGNAKSSSLAISGSGDINSQALIQEHCTSTISGSGDCITTVSKTLEAYISGSGTLFYIGSPAIATHITGSGSVQKY
jgi:hypothetical protein